MKEENSLIRNRTVKNAVWIIGCKVVQALLGLLITMFSARYLGPSGYGVINYAASIVAFFVPIMQLGLNATLVREVLDYPDKEGETLGTALVMNFTSGIACIIGTVTFAMFANAGEQVTITVCALYSSLLVFQGLEMIQYWFQAKLLSKYTSIVMLISYAIVSVYKIVLLVAKSHIYWFAISQAVDFAIIAVCLLIIYKKVGTQKLSVSKKRAADMFSRSKHYILSGMMITVFAETDKIMLKMMLGEAAVGYYAAAATCTAMTTFVFVAIIDSSRPSILEGQNESESIFENRLKLLYSIIIFLALLQSVFITILAKPIVSILYGSQYEPAIGVLRILVWYSTFSYIGSVKDIWILAKDKQSWLWIINLLGAITNIILNAVLIPLLGVNGAAIASLVTQFFTNVVVTYLIKPIRPNSRIMLQSLKPKYLVVSIKKFLKKK